jgi:hypothetical protein
MEIIDNVILGAGIAGLGASYALHQRGEKSVIFERDNTYGGLCGNFTIDGFRFDRFVHFTFSKDEQVNAIFNASSPEIYRHLPEAYNIYKGIWIKHPAQNNLYPLSEEEKQIIIKDFMNRKSPDEMPINNYEDWLRLQFGNYFAEHFPMVYTRKYWMKEASELRMGNPMDESTDIGPVINESSAINIETSVNRAIEDGAELLLGGNRRDCFYEPTILDNVTMDMDIVANETFGPIAPIIRVDGLDEAIKEANNTQYGLQAGVFTESIHSALRCANEIDAGSVLINKESTFRTDAMPFGGFKSSGMGKEGIRYAVEDMCKTKLIAFNCR